MQAQFALEGEHPEARQKPFWHAEPGASQVVPLRHTQPSAPAGQDIASHTSPMHSSVSPLSLLPHLPDAQGQPWVPASQATVMVLGPGPASLPFSGLQATRKQLNPEASTRAGSRRWLKRMDEPWGGAGLLQRMVSVEARR